MYWHFFQGYQDWPLEDYDEVTSDHPPYGAFCSICLHEHVEHLRRHWKEIFRKIESK